MSKPISFGQLDVELTASMNSENGIEQTETPFKIAVIGDFSGRASRGIVSPKDMRPIMVDRDNLDELIDKLDVEVHLSLEDETKTLDIGFKELDDFHPDQIYSRLDIFKSLRDIRRALNKQDSYASAAEEVKTWFPSQQKHSETQNTIETPSPLPSSGSLLDHIVTETTGETPVSVQQDSKESELASFLHHIVDPHIVPPEDPQKDDLITAVDTVISQLMDAILHHPEFQTIESAWRSIHFLVRRLETGTDLKIYLFDVSKKELIIDIGSTENLSTTAFYQYFVKQTVETYGGTSWAVIAGNYHFDHTIENIEVLGRIAKIAQKAGAPFIVGASDTVLGCESLAATPDPSAWRTQPSEEIREAWKMLRNIQESSYIGLALPNFILRLPYGEDTDPIDMFEFEEFPSPAGHYGYLWGNSAIACVFLLGKSFTLNGWNMRAHMIHDIENLPLHIYKENGESKIKACAEMVMTEHAAATIMEKGFIPLLSYMNQDKIRLGRFQSIADPPTQLAGSWK